MICSDLWIERVKAGVVVRNSKVIDAKVIDFTSTFPLMPEDVALARSQFNGSDQRRFYCNKQDFMLFVSYNQDHGGYIYLMYRCVDRIFTLRDVAKVMATLFNK